MKQDAVISRLKIYLSYKGLTAKDFERLTGLGNGTAARLSESTRQTTYDRISKSGVDLNAEWLKTGVGEMLRPTVSGESGNAILLGRPSPVSSKDEEVVNVRFFQMSPTATFQEFCEGIGDLSDTIPIVPPHGCDVDDETCVFEVSGESMFPSIPNGAKVLCREISASRWHQITSGVVVIAYADKFVIKRVLKNHLSSDNYLVLGSDNPDYPTTEKVARADMRCVFRALYVLSYPIS